MRSSWRTLDRATIRDIALVLVADALVALSFGAVAVAGGLALWVPVVMSLLVFAGGAQFAAIGIVIAGGSPWAAVATGLVLNARHLPFGFAVADVLGAPGTRLWARVLGPQVLFDESVAFTLRQPDPPRRRAAFWVSGISLFVVWNIAVVIGGIAGSLIGDTDAFGLDAAFPAVLLALVLPNLADGPTRRAALTGGAIALAVTPWAPAGIPVLLALVGIVVALHVPAAPAAGPTPGQSPGGL